MRISDWSSDVCSSDLDRVTFLRAQVLENVETRQADWHGWTWRNARRLAAAKAALGPTAPTPIRAPYGRMCDGTVIPPPPPAPHPVSPPASPLTAEPKQ